MKKSINDIKSIKEQMYNEIVLRLEKNENTSKCKYKRQIMICSSTGCASSNSLSIAKKLEEEIKAQGLENEVQVIKSGCFGLCALGPIAIVYPEGAFYSKIKVEDVPKIVEQHLKNNQVVKELLYQETVTDTGIRSLQETPFYAKQHRVVLRNCGVIDPENIDEYIARDGYLALAKCLEEYTPSQVIDIMKESGLRGRGGAGFPTGVKWSLAAVNEADQKYVCCNGDEGDPGAFMDRSILEGDPHTVLEAMAIAGYAIGATKGYIYVRAEYPVAIKRLQIAINQAKDYGLLGTDIYGKGFDFDIEIKLGAGAFVCGEETALMTSIEGKRGEPRPRPPFPALKGLFGKPSILNNVETYANVTQIILNGSDWFRSIGTEKSKGTKVFALGGKINHTGLVEVPMGTTLREIIEEIGGGIPDGKKFKAAQTGGPSGGCISTENFDVQIDYDNLIKIGSMMGSGGLIVMDETSCMVDIAKFFLDFTVDESCGKCTPCRVGNKRMLEILDKITKGNAQMSDLEKLKELSQYIKDNSLCGLGQTAPNPVISTMRYFGDEYIEHIRDKKCRAGVCKDLLKYVIDKDKCKGCSACARVCPVSAISGEIKSPFVIDQDKCIKCGTCIEKCKFGAIYKK